MQLHLHIETEAEQIQPLPAYLACREGEWTVHAEAVEGLVAVVAESDEGLYLQPAGPGAVRIGGEEITEAIWLRQPCDIGLGYGPEALQFHCEPAPDRVELTERPPALAMPPQQMPVGIIAEPVKEAPVETPEAVHFSGPTDSKSGSGNRMHRGLLLGLIGISAVLLFLVGSVLFLSLSPQVSFRTQPVDASVQFDSARFKHPFRDAWVVRKGAHEVAISAPGHQSVTQAFQVNGSRNVVEVNLQPLPGVVSITTEPAGVDVLVAGKKVAVSPCEISLPNGTHSVELAKTMYISNQTNLSVVGFGETQTLHRVLTPATGLLTLSSSPSRAEVHVNGKASGKSTPCQLELLEGDQSIELIHPGYESWKTQFVVTATERYAPDAIQMVPAKVPLVLRSSPPGAIVMLNELSQSNTPVTLYVQPGEPQHIQVMKSGFAQVTDTLEIPIGGREERHYNLVENLLEVAFESEPSGAEVRRGTEVLGKTPLRLKLAEHMQVMSFHLSGYEVAQRKVLPNRRTPGQRVLVRMMRKSSPAVATAPGPRPSTSPGPNTAGMQVKGMVRIPAGDFVMGADINDTGRSFSEKKRMVTIQCDFFLGVHEVTNGEFRQFRPQHSSGSRFGLSLNGNNQPVVSVNWVDAIAYCNWKSQQEGLTPCYEQVGGKWLPVEKRANGYRLPTEAEWEYCAKWNHNGKRDRVYPWGNREPDLDTGNMADTFLAQKQSGPHFAHIGDRFAVTANVGYFEPNLLGIFDLAGNVAEWCEDAWTVNRRIDSGLPREHFEKASGFVVKGSSYLDCKIRETRCAFRRQQNKADTQTGFRLCRSATEE